MMVDLKIKKYLATMCLNDFLKWVEDVGRPCAQDKEFLETWVENYLIDRYHG